MYGCAYKPIALMGMFYKLTFIYLEHSAYCFFFISSWGALPSVNTNYSRQKGPA